MKMNLTEWLQLLESRQPASFEMGTQRIDGVAKALDLQLTMPVITVAGTNGKGSTVRMLECILTAAGWRVGCFYSPHLIDFRERIAIGGAPADEKLLCECFARIEQALTANTQLVPPTYFEFITLAAADAFARQRCDAVIFEVGLGGRLDATNAFDADVAVITSVGIDHVEHLGGDRESIGREKAGIMRPGKPAVCGDLQPPASLVAHAQQLGARLLVRGRDFAARPAENSWNYQGQSLRCALPPPAMRGTHQYANAACALCALEQLEARLPVDQSAVRCGLAEAQLAGRFEVLPGPVSVVLDIAHNVPACERLADCLLDMGYFEHTFAVFGSLSRKDGTGMIKTLAGRVDQWFIAPIGEDDERQQAADAAVATVEAAGGKAGGFASIAQAAEAAHALAPKGARIVVLGSFLTVAQYRSGRGLDHAPPAAA